jgi:hypothetical protein
LWLAEQLANRESEPGHHLGLEPVGGGEGHDTAMAPVSYTAG